MNRIGEETITFHACYIKAKELGYDDITVEWPRVKYTYPMDKNIKIFFPPMDCSVLPMKFISKESINFHEYDKIIDLDKDNALYDGYPSANPSIGIREHIGFYEYLNKYYIDTKIIPMIEPIKDKTHINILFHYRNAAYSKTRDSSIEEIKSIIKLLNENLNKKNIIYNITGDIFSQEDYLNFILLTPNVYRPFLRNISKLFVLVSKMDLIICPSSGMVDIGGIFGIPFIMMNVPRIYKDKPYANTEEYWKLHNRKYGKDMYSYKGPDNYKFYFTGESYNLVEDVIKMVDRISKEKI